MALPQLPLPLPRLQFCGEETEVAEADLPPSAGLARMIRAGSAAVFSKLSQDY